ncbi:glucuronate isomerase [Flagellimonas onchidii]|uniref:glucuronate isomerase n=1 Tax=Flagellimonas onchidii TaxID=2562684 RepID=UPI0010A65735|nr:glucuronate isomerase [Allomuricauda onchidii]
MRGKPTFVNENFLLQNRYAQELYHDHAAQMPIIDYHNHLDPQQLANDHRFENISQAWLAGDHYKWRAMRTMGINEEYITGKASDEKKFLKWAGIVPYLVRNPLYHWTHLELQRYFGIDQLLSKENAEEIYAHTSSKLQEKSHSALGLVQQMNVEMLCTTDDPIDDLKYHQKAKGQNQIPKMLPTFRPDKAYAVEDSLAYRMYLDQLMEASGVSIGSFADLLDALKNRIDYFHKNGCRLADHGLSQLYFFEEGTYDIEKIFQKVLLGVKVENREENYFKFLTLSYLCKEYHAKGWTQQFHLGPLRNTNQRMLEKLGPDSGFDSIGDLEQAYPMSKFLNLLDATDHLAKTILYNLNPAQNDVFAAMTGNFNDGSVKGKIQYGSAWWYSDQLDGMEKQINTLSNIGILSCFVGMLTDSRSLLSFPRHEYFRRLLCNILGNDIEKGLLPTDIPHLGKIVQDICYNNAKAYFKF